MHEGKQGIGFNKNINQLKERGVYTILADWNEEPVAKKYCDKYYRESTLDFEKIKQIEESKLESERNNLTQNCERFKRLISGLSTNFNSMPNE